MAFRDMTFCNAPWCNGSCGRQWTPALAAEAKAWWGDLPGVPRVAFSSICAEPVKEEDLLFQRYSHDHHLRGASSQMDDGPEVQTHRAGLTPRAYHENAKDVTVGWELERALVDLVETLK